MVSRLSQKILFMGLYFGLLSACMSSEYDDRPYERSRPHSPEEITFIKSALGNIQRLSIQKNREYCGFVGLDMRGNFALTKPRKGRKGSCRPKEPNADFTILASFHTHGAFSLDYDSEVPSVDDLSSDIEEGNDGYVITPGGRLWYNDANTETTTLLCGIHCLPFDPNFEEDTDFAVAPTYTLEQLEVREDAVN